MSLKIKVINRKTGKELEMLEKDAQKLNRLIKIPIQEKISIPKEYKKAKEVLPENLSLEERKIMLRARRIHWNDAKRKIAVDMLERYTGHNIEDFQKQIILTNFSYYTQRFNALMDDAHTLFHNEGLV
jgi:AMP nucleosidase